MPFNGSGTFSLTTAGQPVVTETVISSTMFNAVLTELEVGLSTCVTKDGQTTTTGTIPIASLQVDAIVNDTGLAAGTYVPTLTNTTNVAASTVPDTFKYMRVSNVVTVSGAITVQATAGGGTSTVLGISLPVASNIALPFDLSGTGLCSEVAGSVTGDATNNRATLGFSAQTTSNFTWVLMFQYQVI